MSTKGKTQCHKCLKFFLARDHNAAEVNDAIGADEPLLKYHCDDCITNPPKKCNFCYKYEQADKKILTVGDLDVCGDCLYKAIDAALNPPEISVHYENKY